MTPAIEAARRAGVAHQVHAYEHDPSAGSAYGLEAAEKLGVAQERVFKTLVVSLDQRQLAVAVVPVAARLSMKHMATAMGGKKAAMADPAAVQRATGYVLGGVSPLGQKKRLPTVVDASATRQATMLVSAGRRGLELELATEDLLRLTGGRVAALCQ